MIEYEAIIMLCSGKVPVTEELKKFSEDNKQHKVAFYILGKKDWDRLKEETESNYVVDDTLATGVYYTRSTPILIRDIRREKFRGGRESILTRYGWCVYSTDPFINSYLKHV